MSPFGPVLAGAELCASVLETACQRRDRQDPRRPAGTAAIGLRSARC